MVKLCFPKDFTIEFSGSGYLERELNGYYTKLASADTDSNPDLTCNITRFEPQPSEVLGKPTQYFGRNGDWLLKVDKYKRLRVNGDWSEIHFSPEVPKAWGFKLLEYCARRALSEEGLSLIHASSAKVNGKTMAFPAWRHTGKTNTLLALLEHFEGDYLSDDRLWLGDNGSVHGFPLPVNLQPYNYNAFPQLEAPTRSYDQRYQISNWVRGKTSDTGPFISQALYFLNEFYIAPSPQTAHIEDIKPEIKYSDEAPLDTLVCLQTVTDSSESSSVELTEISTERASTYLRSISHFEWNGMISEYVSARDMLFEESSAMRDYESLLTSEWEIWNKVLDGIETYALTIPREENWDRQKLSEKVIAELAPLVD
jgi:hypothetical protein